MLRVPKKSLGSFLPLYLLLGCWVSQLGFGASDYVSTMVGGGYAVGDQKRRDLETLQNYGMLRFGFHPGGQRFFWSLDLENFRIQRRAQFLSEHHHAEGAGIASGFRGADYGFWLQVVEGTIRNLQTSEDSITEISQRYRYQSVSFGISYSLYYHRQAAIEIQSFSRMLKTERAWKQTYGFKNLQLFSILIALTLADI